MSNVIYLIRHGISEWNKLGIIQWWQYNVWLSEEWKNNVKELSNTFYEEIELVRCSPFDRALETAHFFAIPRNISIIIHEELKEFWSWILQWLSHTQAEQKYPREYEVRKNRWDLDEIEWAETWNELQARVLFFLLEYKDKNIYKELIVSHAWFLRCLINTILMRARTTPIDVSHNFIHKIEDVFDKLKFVKYGIWANSEIYLVKTFENSYIIKKTNKWSLGKLQFNKNIVSYLNKGNNIVTPPIFFSREKKKLNKNYFIEIMQFIDGEHLQWSIIWDRVDMITSFFRQISDRLYQYFEKAGEVGLNSLKYKIADWLQYIETPLLDIEKITLFLEKNTLQQSMVYYDIHNQNLLFTKDGIVLLDLDSFLICPKEFQLACVVTFFMLEDINPDFKKLIKLRWEDIDQDVLKLLIKTRCLIGIIFFSKKNKQEKSDNNLFYLNKYLDIYNSIIIK